MCLLERNISQGAVMEMGVYDGCLKERDKLHGTAMKLRAINTRSVKGGLPDPAHSEGAVAKTGKVKIRVVRYAVNRHPVKVSFTEKVGRKAGLCRLVIEPLVHDFQRAIRVKVKEAVFVLHTAALGVGLGQKRLLFQKRLYIPADFLHLWGIVIAARIPQAGQKSIHRPLCSALQNVVDRPYSLGVICAVVKLRPHIFQKISGPDTDLMGSQDFLMLVYGIRLLRRK